MLFRSIGYTPIVETTATSPIILSRRVNDQSPGLSHCLQHSNVDMRLGPLRWVFAWAPMHRLHHMKYGRAGDVNFGLFFNLWDWLLGTAFYSHEYPIRDGDLGIGSRPDFPVDYWPQLLDPFQAPTLSREPQVPPPLRR